MVGSQADELFEIAEKTGTVQPLVRGHAEGEIWGLRAHPGKSLFATGSDDGRVCLWDLLSKVPKSLLLCTCFVILTVAIVNCLLHVHLITLVTLITSITLITPVSSSSVFYYLLHVHLFNFVLLSG